MTVPFMNAYVELLIKTCHRRGVHAMGGTPSFKTPDTRANCCSPGAALFAPLTPAC